MIMRFLNPKTDYAFKKIFGSEQSHDILISFLNAILNLTGAEVIVQVVINDPYQAPKFGGMKDTFLDVKVKDQSGRFYIVEMQVLSVDGFEKRVLYNTCKAYVNQLSKGDAYRSLTGVVAVTITDFVLFPELNAVVTQFELCAQENRDFHYQNLALVFAELPKFNLTELELNSPLDRWLYFMKTARNLTDIPQSLASEPAIVHALELANRAGWSEEELDDVEKREMWLADQQYVQAKLEAAEQRAAIAEQCGLKQGREEGKLKGKAELLLQLLQLRFSFIPASLLAQIETADAAQLKQWTERFVTADTLLDIFGRTE
jgi:predicted transposase/invertase (TIGR01784 family)